jgi:hypothetical protein
MVQFRRSKKFGPLRLSLSNRGLSGSVGGGPLRVGRGTDRRLRRTVRVPGTGIYDVKTIGDGQRAGGAGRGVLAVLGWLIIAAVLFAWKPWIAISLVGVGVAIRLLQRRSGKPIINTTEHTTYLPPPPLD